MTYYYLLIILALQRLCEVRHGSQNLEAVRDRLYEPPVASEKRGMILLHASWFLCCGLEYSLRGSLAPPGLFLAGMVILALCQYIRFRSMNLLGESWIHLPVAYEGQKIVTWGLYRHFRHPNYLVVAVEIALVPLLGRAYLTALFFSILNLFFLRRRIRMEEAQLQKVRSAQ